MRADVCFVVGARPNFMKVAPLFRAVQELAPELDLRLVHTGQHYDAAMSDVFIGELGLPAPSEQLESGSGPHGAQTARMLDGLEQIFLRTPARLVVVAGDVNSTLAGGLAAAKLGIPVAHLEAGLRSGEEALPEEINRRLVDHLSALLLAHSQPAVDSLAAEGIAGGQVVLIGNTMVDTVLSQLERARARAPWERLGVEPGAFGLVTLHRPTLVDDPVLLAEAVEELTSLARTIPLVFPVHPRTLTHLGAFDGGARVVLTPPLGYLDFLGLESAARFVLTDSGGIQEETSALGVPCFTLREQTERPVTVALGTNTVLGARPERIAEIPALLREQREPQPIPLWDGRAGERGAEALTRFLARQPALAHR
jgi:UDP-N-acetylglucosamine 2-epimerase (non-hydrolysing)